MSTCPSCGDDANTQKVSGLYRAQSGRRGISELAELLEPPMKPPQVGEYLGFAGGSILLVLMLAFGLLGLIVFFIPGMLLGMLAGGLLGERLGTVYENITEPDKSAKAKIENERRASKYRLRLEHWEHAYYCRKHDAVILNDGKVLSPIEFKRLMTGEA